nr:uroporphyrinogen-III synthase [Flavobacterium sp. HXWNR69]
MAVNQKQFLLNAGFKVMDEDFISINPIPYEIDDANDILIFTSQNTVQNILKHKDKLILKPVLCVGDKTKQMLINHGFTVLNAQPEASELIKIIDDAYLDKSFTFFCGTSRLNTIPDFLKEKKLKHKIIEVYETIETPITIQSKMDSILFFSPSGVSSYVKDNSIIDEICFCIGNTTAKAVEKYSKNIVIANQPTVENVIIQCINYYKANS